MAAQEEPAQSAAAERKPEAEQNIMVIRDLHYARGPRKIFDGLNLEIPRGRVGGRPGHRTGEGVRSAEYANVVEGRPLLRRYDHLLGFDLEPLDDMSRHQWIR